MARKFLIRTNRFLTSGPVAAWHSLDYLGWRQEGNPDFLNVLKNTFGSESIAALRAARRSLEQVLREDLAYVRRALRRDVAAVCVPRSKADFGPNQLLFRTAVASAVEGVEGVADLTSAIRRVTSTRTTHIPVERSRDWNLGSDPYPGITAETCDISSAVRGRDILLIDDIYTYGVNIDEDALQALRDAGARSLEFYAVAKAGRSET